MELGSERTMKNKKNYYFGKYYKFISPSGYAFALIDANTVKGRVVQLITKEKIYQVKNPSGVKIQDDSVLSLDIHQKDLNMSGMIYISNVHPLKKDVMGVLRYVKMNTKHNVYSMYHSLEGELKINNKVIRIVGI